MERLAEVDTIVFDKTGTLTHGVPAAVDVISYHDAFSGDHLLGLAVAAETRLRHPVAGALRAYARERRVPVPVCRATDYRIGMGVQAQSTAIVSTWARERFMPTNQIRHGPIGRRWRSRATPASTLRLTENWLD
jgi:cation transport ATPase